MFAQKGAMSIPMTRAAAQAADLADPLAACRAHFVMPTGVTYLVGHSLGPATKGAQARVREAVEHEWADGLVGSWNKAGWIDLAHKVGARLARLVGAAADEVVVCDSVSVNLFKLAGAALPLVRHELVMVEDDEFPTDQYIAEGLAGLAKTGFRKIPAGQGMGALSQGGVLIKSIVNYRSGEIADMAAFEREAALHGAAIIWDLSHGAGIVPVELARSGARFAAGCTYKYLNGGPGAPAFVYVSKDVVEETRSPLPGWLGHKNPFSFTGDYEPADGIGRYTAGTPSILSLSALDGALQAFDGVDIADVHDKAGKLGDMVLGLAEGFAEFGLATASPRDRTGRGGHVSLTHDEGFAVVQALMAQGIQADFRAPSTIRFGLSPLFLSYKEVFDAMEALGQCLRSGSWDQPQFKIRSKVT